MENHEMLTTEPFKAAPSTSGPNTLQVSNINDLVSELEQETPQTLKVATIDFFQNRVFCLKSRRATREERSVVGDEYRSPSSKDELRYKEVGFERSLINTTTPEITPLPSTQYLNLKALTSQINELPSLNTANTQACVAASRYDQIIAAGYFMLMLEKRFIPRLSHWFTQLKQQPLTHEEQTILTQEIITNLSNCLSHWVQLPNACLKQSDEQLYVALQQDIKTCLQKTHRDLSILSWEIAIVIDKHYNALGSTLPSIQWRKLREFLDLRLENLILDTLQTYRPHYAADDPKSPPTHSTGIFRQMASLLNGLKQQQVKLNLSRNCLFTSRGLFDQATQYSTTTLEIKPQSQEIPIAVAALKP